MPQTQVPFTSVVTSCGELPASLLQSALRVATIVIHRAQVVQDTVQTLLIVPSLQTRDYLTSLFEAAEFRVVQARIISGRMAQYNLAP